MLLDVVAEPEGVALGGAAPPAQPLHAGRGSHAGRALSPLEHLPARARCSALMQSLGTPRYAAPPCLPSAAAVGTPPTPGAAAAARLSLATTLTSSSPLVAQRCCAITPPVTPLVTPLVTPHPRAPATGTSPGLACGLRPDNGSSTCASGAVAAGCLRPGSHRPRSRCYLLGSGTSPRSSREARHCGPSSGRRWLQKSGKSGAGGV